MIKTMEMKFHAVQWWWSRAAYEINIGQVLEHLGLSACLLFVMITLPIWWPIRALCYVPSAVRNKYKFATGSLAMREKALGRSYWRKYIY